MTMHFSLDDGVPAASGSETRINCPFCSSRGKPMDTKRHLYVHTCGGQCQKCRSGRNLDGFYVCHRCGAKGKTGSDGRSLKVTPWGITVAKILGHYTEPEEQLEIPDDYVPVDDRMEAYAHLLSRGFTPEDIEYFKIGIGTRQRRGRIIIPSVTLDGVVEFWVARDYTDKSSLRYLNPSNSFRRRAVFNLERASEFPWMIVTEGPVSAIIAGRNAIGTYGKEVAPEQVTAIVRAYRLHSHDFIVLALDGDAKDKQHGLALELGGRGCKVFTVDMPYGKDPADFGRDGFFNKVASAKRFNVLQSLKTRVQAI